LTRETRHVYGNVITSYNRPVNPVRQSLNSQRANVLNFVCGRRLDDVVPLRLNYRIGIPDRWKSIRQHIYVLKGKHALSVKLFENTVSIPRTCVSLCTVFLCICACEYVYTSSRMYPSPTQLSNLFLAPFCQPVYRAYPVERDTYTHT